MKEQLYMNENVPQVIKGTKYHANRLKITKII